MKRTRLTDDKLATKWACDERTIRRWRRDHAPLQDPKRMRAWLAGRKHLPPGTVALLEATRTTERAAGAVQEHTQPEGAAGALRRLEQAEARAYADFRRAAGTGDDVAIKAARETWLRISESLRRFDLALEQARRDSGDLIVKAEIEKALRTLGGVMRISAEQGICDIAVAVAGEPDIIRTRKILEKFGYAVAAWSFSALGPMGVPRWMAECLAADLTDHTTIKKEHLWLVAEEIAGALKTHAAQLIAEEPSLPNYK